MSDPFDLSGKVALVAGASRGIGEAVAKTLAARGAAVICTSRKIDACQAVADAITAEGGTARAMTLHLGTLTDHDAVLASIRDTEGRLDILVNNGATNPYFGPATDAPEDAFDKTFEVNVKGPYFLTAKASALLKADGGGAVVNVASVNGKLPGFWQGPYSMTKAAVINMTQMYAQELGTAGVRVNALLPGLTDTKLASALTADTERLNEMMQRAFSLPRVGQPQEMANAILFLASNASSYMTGHSLVVDGGYTARGSL